MVLTPRVCWNWLVTAALGAAFLAPALRAETKVLFWAGAAANWRADWRRARVTGLEAIVNVCVCGLGYLGVRNLGRGWMAFKLWGSTMTTV